MEDSLGREQAVGLHQALERASIGHRRLWVRYLYLGGTADELEVSAYLHQCLDLPVRERDLLIRPLGATVYVMPPYSITEDELDRVYDAIGEVCGAA